MWEHMALGETMWLFLSASCLINKVLLFFFFFLIRTCKFKL